MIKSGRMYHSRARELRNLVVQGIPITVIVGEEEVVKDAQLKYRTDIPGHEGFYLLDGVHDSVQLPIRAILGIRREENENGVVIYEDATKSHNSNRRKAA